MNKYIDAEKLKKYIEHKRNCVCDGLDWDDMDDSQRYVVEYIDDILSAITSLQQEQSHKSFCEENCKGYRDTGGKCFFDFNCSAKKAHEQPKVDLVAELKHYLATTPKEQLEKEWKELEPWDNIGPTVQEFLYGKQPEVELEKLGEIARHIIAVKENVEDMRLNEDEWSVLERIGYPERFNINTRKEE